MSIRPAKRLIRARPAMEGAGVHLRIATPLDRIRVFAAFIALAIPGVSYGIPVSHCASVPAQWPDSTVWLIPVEEAQTQDRPRNLTVQQLVDEFNPGFGPGCAVTVNNTNDDRIRQQMG